jgi:acyl-CoA thioester hydrolase
VTQPFSHRIEVRFRDCDPLGHVNNAVYLTYLEQARLFHWRALWGFGMDASSTVPGVILAHAQIDFKRPVTYPETLEVRLRVAAIGTSSFTYDYEVLDANAGVVASARTVQVMYDYATGRPVPIPADIRAKLDAIS